MKFCLNTKIIEPDNKENIDNAIILLHGYGGDGQDISMLTLGWKRFLKNTVFLCPDGRESCVVNPTGYQWFDLSREDPKYILEESKKAEVILLKFLEEVKKKYNLKSSKIILSGFSQGCMMSINLGLISSENYNCIIGFSGKIIDKIDLEKIKISTTKIKKKKKIVIKKTTQEAPTEEAPTEEAPAEEAPTEEAPAEEAPAEEAPTEDENKEEK